MKPAPALLALLLAACAAKSDAPPPAKRTPMAFPVNILPVEVRKLEYSIQATGGLEAYERVQVSARVGGVVDRVLFSEGDPVAAGQPLVEIEADRFRLRVKAAKAALDRAQVAKADAETQLSRRDKANAETPGLVREDELDQYRSRARLAQADETAARITLDQAELDLRDAVVRAPAGGTIDGRIVQTGQYLQPGALLATLVRKDPLLVKFQVPVSEANEIRLRQRVTFRVRGQDRAYSALVSHIGDAADGTTRMVQITARVDEIDRRNLRPGAFAELRIPIGGVEAAPVILQTAVRPSERGFLGFVVEGDTAKERVLQLGLRTDDGLVQVRSGVSAGEQIVVRGAEALRDGAKVKVVDPSINAPGKQPQSQEISTPVAPGATR